MHASRRRIAAAGSLAAIAATTLFAGPAHGAPSGYGPGLGVPVFPLEPLTTGASSNPRVIVGADGTALAAFGSYPPPKGVFHVCLVPRAASACTRVTTVSTADGVFGTSLVGPLAAPLLVNGTANYTETFASADGGATFGPARKVSRYTNAQNALPLPDGRLVLVGTGNDSDSNAMHVVTVPGDGSGVDVTGFRFPGAYSNRGLAFNGGRFVALSASFVSSASTQTQVNYAIYSGAGDPNAVANWTLGTLPLNISDPPAVASGPSGTVMIAPVAGKVVVSRLSGTTWSPVQAIGDAAGGVYLPNLTQDAAGRLTATWQVNGVGLRLSQSYDGIHWSAPVTINAHRFFQTDTATAPDGGGLAVTRGDGRYEATRLYRGDLLTLSATPSALTKGKKTKLAVRLVDDRAAPIAGAKVTVKRGALTVATLTTGATGRASVTVKPARSTSYVASYAGSAVDAAFRTRAKKVTVKRPKTR